MSAEILRRAAHHMREVAEDANRCLSSRNCKDPAHRWYGFDEMAERLDDDSGALYIVTMPPAVALAVAAWLDEEAEYIETTPRHKHDLPSTVSALNVARAYLGESA